MAASAAAAASSGTDWGAGIPEPREKKPGSSSVPTATTGTPRVSSTSSVAGTSRIALGPAQTTTSGVRASSSRSTDTSRLGGRTRLSGPAEGSKAPAWTPPIPPVAKTRMPAAWAASIVADTVVAPQPPEVSAPASVGRATFRTSSVVASASSVVSSRPTSRRPSRTATVAGTAPLSRTAASEARATSRFCGYGQAVADERGFEGDDRAAGGQRRGNLGGDDQTGAHARRAAGRRAWRPV